MNRLWFGIACLCMSLPLAGTLRGQALPTASGPGSYVALGGEASLFNTDYGQQKVAGVGGYLDIQPHWRYGVEAEARTLRYHTSEDVSEANYLVGPKVAILRGRIQPYGKFLVGAGHIVLPYRYAEGNFLTYSAGGGVEYFKGDRVIFRLVDFEYQRWPDFPYGELRPYGISAGISIRLNPVKRYPGHKYRH